MFGIYLAAFFVAIVIVVYWTKVNDSVPLGEKTKGLLQMTFGGNVKEDPRRPGAGASAERQTRPQRGPPAAG